MKFEESMIKNCDISNLSLTKTEFVECMIVETIFESVDLTCSNFTNSNLDKSQFKNSNLSKVDFRSAKNYLFDPRENNIEGAMFSSPEVLSLLHSFNIKIDF
jgi:uncharacterized protein YjbI with pentapeptide repeats